MKTRIYLAARFSEKLKMREFRDYLNNVPHFDVISSWIDSEYSDHKELSEPERYEIALIDLHEVEESHVLVHYSPPYADGAGHGGRFIEVGYALGTNVPVLLLGERRSCMEYNQWIHILEDPYSMQDVKEAIEKLFVEYWN